MVHRASSLVQLQDLEVLLAVSEGRSFRHASKRVGVEPSAISRRIRAVEDRLGVSLFERHTTGVRLTAAGERFIYDIRGALAQIDHATRSVQEAGVGGHGVVTIGFAGGLASPNLSDLLLRFKSEHSSVQLQLLEGTSIALTNHVLNHALDVAFVVGSPLDRGLDSMIVWDEALYISLPSDDLRTHSAELTLEALAGDVLIISNCVQGRECEKLITSELEKAGLQPNFAHHRVSREALMLMVGLGFGAVITREPETSIVYPNVKFTQLSNLRTRISMTWLPDNGNPALRRFLSLVRRLFHKKF